MSTPLAVKVRTDYPQESKLAGYYTEKTKPEEGSPTKEMEMKGSNMLGMGEREERAEAGREGIWWSPSPDGTLAAEMFREREERGKVFTVKQTFHSSLCYFQKSICMLLLGALDKHLLPAFS